MDYNVKLFTDRKSTKTIVDFIDLDNIIKHSELLEFGTSI